MATEMSMEQAKKLNSEQLTALLESDDWPKVDPGTGEEWWPEQLFEDLAP